PSRVVHLAADGRVDDAWTGLSALAGIALGPDGALYAAERSTGDDEAASPGAGTGKVVRQTGPTTQSDVAPGLEGPAALRFGPDGGLYVAGAAFGPAATLGAIVRLGAGGGTPIPAVGACPETPHLPSAGESSP